MLALVKNIGLAVSDLTACDREPITRLERVQSFGFLLAVNAEWVVERVSDNVRSLLGVEPGHILGQPLESWMEARALHDIRGQMMRLQSPTSVERLFGKVLVAGRPAFDVGVHYSEATIVIEGEPSRGDDRLDAASLVRAMMARLNTKPTFEALHLDAARQVRAMTGFDRVMIYRFDESGAGEVIAEAVTSGMVPFMGLHYPASDIPVQARALYLRCPFRIIADVVAATVPLLAREGCAAQPLDLSLAITRAVSPVHLEYLQNMDVAASLSISIIVRGALWGMVVCHHPRALLPSFVVRTAAELFGQMYSLTLESRLRQADGEADERVEESVEGIVVALAADESLFFDAEWLLAACGTLIQCDGLAIKLRGTVSTSGSVPPTAKVAALLEQLDAMPANRVFATDHLTALRPEAALHASDAAGVLAIPISRVSRDYILLFRREWAHEIKWGGNPDKAVLTTDPSMRLSPRKSFEAFSRSVSGHSLPFSARDRRTARSLRSSLIETILEFSEHGEEEQKKTSERQEMLIAELNHRVRNILTLIRGLVSQTGGGAANDLATYVESLNGRIQALARAHDQITRQNWGPGRLTLLLHEEFVAYLPESEDRFTLVGPEVMLHPQAFSTMSLVVHELVTNSAKYGALSASGRVTVSLERRPGEGLSFGWKERGGPEVAKPQRRGFGSVVLERIVPFDLKGTAEIRYEADGLAAEFFIPEAHLAPDPQMPMAGMPPPALQAAAKELQASNDEQPLRGMSVLLLEDNMIMALETEDLLRDLGAGAVFTASSVAAAAQILKRERLDFALLDINVGAQTSYEFAAAVAKGGVPYAFASGYGENVDLGPQHAGVSTVSKPYGRAALSAAIGRQLRAVPVR